MAETQGAGGPAPTQPLSRYSRETLERFVELALEELDRRDGDPEAEPSEGDLDHLADDDALPRHRHRFTPIKATIRRNPR